MSVSVTKLIEKKQKDGSWKLLTFGIKDEDGNYVDVPYFRHCNLDFRDNFLSSNYSHGSFAERGVPSDISKEAKEVIDKGKEYAYGHTWYTSGDIEKALEVVCDDKERHDEKFAYEKVLRELRKVVGPSQNDDDEKKEQDAQEDKQEYDEYYNSMINALNGELSAMSTYVQTIDNYGFLSNDYRVICYKS